MNDIIFAPFIKELAELASNMYRLGWDERNGGNISCLLSDDEIKEYLPEVTVKRIIPIGFSAQSLAGKVFLVTGTGKYFKNIEKDPANNLGIIRISVDGENAELLWGFEDGGRFTSELPAHLMTHVARLAADREHRVVIHTHPTYTIAMNITCPADEKDFTLRLWKIQTESIVVFPEGVGLLPWMVCGNTEIGRATAEKMKTYRLVIWTNHGIYGTGKSLDEAFGLIETVEKAAQLYMLTGGHERVNLISDEQLAELARAFGIECGCLT
jgi:rhamnulose-1-phosphate aldolase